MYYFSEVFLFLDQSEVLLPLIHDSCSFLVSFFPDVEDMIPLRDEVSGFAMDLLDEWTGRIDPSHIPRSKLSKIARTCPVGRYDDERIRRDFLEIRLKYHPLAFEHLHDKSIVNDLMIHIDRCGMHRYDFHEHTDSTMDSCTVATGIGGEERERHIIFYFSTHLLFSSEFRLLSQDFARLGHLHRRRQSDLPYIVPDKDRSRE